jgi:hypothetical protein
MQAGATEMWVLAIERHFKDAYSFTAIFLQEMDMIEMLVELSQERPQVEESTMALRRAEPGSAVGVRQTGSRPRCVAKEARPSPGGKNKSKAQAAA